MAPRKNAATTTKDRPARAPRKASTGPHKPKTAPKATAKQPAKVTPKPEPARAQSQEKLPRWAATIAVDNAWEGPPPDTMPELRGTNLEVRFHLAHDGQVWSELYLIRGSDGEPLGGWWKLPMDYRCQVERDDRNRPIRLPKAQRSKTGLQQWLIDNELLLPEDATT